MENFNTNEQDWGNEQTWLQFWETSETIKDELTDRMWLESQKKPEVQKEQYEEDLGFIKEKGLDNASEITERLMFLKTYKQNNRTKSLQWKNYKVKNKKTNRIT
ncbi:hypothetical protein M0R04_08705 [Candidatus Dojkabacteria bacterium]|jgi:hypothetical protein|nr:hypothetical protein [Candidatus Dojkabacteria bacterium]